MRVPPPNFDARQGTLVASVATFLLLALAVFGQSLSAGEFPSMTQDRVSNQHWWPTKGTPSFKAYAGESACGECHSNEFSSQVNTPMAQAAIRLSQNARSPKLAAGSWQSASYLYQVSSDHLGSRLAVSSSGHSIAANIGWIFGAGVRGQTYILEKNGLFYESQVSTFATLRGMDVTPGHTQIEAGDLKKALGEHLSTFTATRCFACHTTYSSTDSKFDLSHVIPGVRCEGCHGPAVNHIKAIRAAKIDEASKAILNPARLGPVDSVDFCGACHRTSMDVVVSAEAYSPINVRFQPYRLEKSRCWGTQGDRRLTCIACHNPHEPLVQSASFYDQRCLSCHSSRGSEPAGPGPPHAVCPKATANCTSCHMPKYDVPEMHAKFTDHFIRVVRAGESYPN